ncbi:hypothetical protein BJ912DRAFT_1009143 [Pholiota molesta]|nr:hypothetical protein BJ912DRAFT_1009143 [Pholiota molesta]
MQHTGAGAVILARPVVTYVTAVHSIDRNLWPRTCPSLQRLNQRRRVNPHWMNRRNIGGLGESNRKRRGPFRLAICH